MAMGKRKQRQEAADPSLGLPRQILPGEDSGQSRARLPSPPSVHTAQDKGQDASCQSPDAVHQSSTACAITSHLPRPVSPVSGSITRPCLKTGAAGGWPDAD